MAQLTRRNFVQVACMTAATAVLAACGNTAAPAADPAKDKPLLKPTLAVAADEVKKDEAYGRAYPADYIYDSDEAVPHCTCGGMIRPDVTLYGESLPVDAWEGAERLIRKADCLIVGGTSLTVYPAASLVRYYSGGYLIIVNRDATGQEEWADLTFHESIGEVFSKINV